MGQSRDCGMAPSRSFDALSSSLRWALSCPSPYCLAFHLRSIPLSPVSCSPPRSLVNFGGSPTSYVQRLPFSSFSAGPQGFSPLPSPNTRSEYPSSSHHPHVSSQSIFLPRSLHPSTLVIAFFSLPSGTEGVWGVFIWALQLANLFEFCGVYLGYSVLFLFGWFWLISTY